MGNRFWLLIAAMVVFKFALVSDLNIQMVRAPVDQELYASRAFYLLQGNGLGPYGPYTLLKLPGFSVWIAAVAHLGIAYFAMMNIIFVLCGIYLMKALLNVGFSKGASFVIFLAYLFNPLTLSTVWTHLLRENLSVCLGVLLFSSLLYLVQDYAKAGFLSVHSLIFSFAFALSVCNREEEILLYALLFLVCAYFMTRHFDALRKMPRRLVPFIAFIAFPIVLTSIFQWSQRTMVKKYYGLPLLSELTEGELPRLLGAMRRVKSQSRRRLVLIPQATFHEIADAIPRLSPVISTLVRCEGNHECFEIENIRLLAERFVEATHEVNSGASLTEIQNFYKEARIGVEGACARGRLSCDRTNGRFLPTFELRWTRPWTKEATRIAQKMLQPEVHVADTNGFVAAGADLGLARQFNSVIFPNAIDTAAVAENSEWEAWSGYPKDVYWQLRFWLKHPEAALNEKGGVKVSPPRQGAMKSLGSVSQASMTFHNPLKPFRGLLLLIYNMAAPFFLGLGFLAFVYRSARWFFFPNEPANAFWVVTLIFLLYFTVRIGAFAYVSLFLGSQETRIFCGTQLFLMVMSMACLAECLGSLRRGVRK